MKSTIYIFIANCILFHFHAFPAELRVLSLSTQFGRFNDWPSVRLEKPSGKSHNGYVSTAGMLRVNGNWTAVRIRMQTPNGHEEILTESIIASGYSSQQSLFSINYRYWGKDYGWGTYHLTSSVTDEFGIETIYTIEEHILNQPPINPYINMVVSQPPLETGDTEPIDISAFDKDYNMIRAELWFMEPGEPWRVGKVWDFAEDGPIRFFDGFEIRNDQKAGLWRFKSLFYDSEGAITESRIEEKNVLPGIKPPTVTLRINSQRQSGIKDLKERGTEKPIQQKKNSLK